MKKVLILYIILFVGSVYSQILPTEFKLSNIKLTQKQLTQLDGSNTPRTGRFAVEPEPTPVIISNFISDIIVVGDTIWFGTGKGITRTTNFGNTFQNYYGMEPFKEDDVSGIAVYGNYIVVATAKTKEVDGDFFPAGTGIKVSNDRGTTWQGFPQPMESGTGRFDTLTYGENPVNFIPALKVLTDVNNLSYDILITRKNLTSDSLVIWITSWAGALRKSLDYGATFTRVVLPPDNLDSIYLGGNYSGANNFAYDPVVNDNHKCFSITSENDSTLYVGTAGGINKSTDWGQSWRKYNAVNSGISGNFVVGLSVQRFGNNTIVWGATNAGGGGGNQGNGFSFTTNSGLIWDNTLTEDAVFSHNIGFKDSIVYAATDNGIWRSYFTVSNFPWSKPSVIYDSTIRDMVRTTFFYAVDSQGDSIWVGSADGLARTRDLGNPWTEKWKIYRGFKQVNSTQESYAAPNPFSPDDEVTRIHYKTGKTSASITIRIFDFAMNPVKVLIQNATRNGPDIQWTAWDGKRDDGMQVANGVYFYRIEVDQDMTFWGKILVLQ